MTKVLLRGQGWGLPRSAAVTVEPWGKCCFLGPGVLGILDGTGLGHPHSRAAPWSEAVPWGLEGGAPSQIPVFPPQCSPLPCLKRGFGILCRRSQWLLQYLLAPFVEMMMLRKRSYEDPAHSLGTCLCVPHQGERKPCFWHSVSSWPHLDTGLISLRTP